MKIEVTTEHGAPTIMTEEEFRQWLDMFLADRTLGPRFEARRVR
ncbi:hypothetical protein HWC34_gp15 [Microbacterium phage Alex44]|uniref:Uncharacterized protein n=1 Tax=Microbacterium phage Alex44 TaxID=2590877 RepID=A0A4Y6ED65_9CAUD|nr:hypothetical protein HWC34_gp15 [Microbacterium phage Alex44]QDF15925.1 hypothetical protein SEA_ALEX44_15 [Microbacterium phage Alex44]